METWERGVQHAQADSFLLADGQIGGDGLAGIGGVGTVLAGDEEPRSAIGVQRNGRTARGHGPVLAMLAVTARRFKHAHAEREGSKH